MTDVLSRLAAALSDRYRIERELNLAGTVDAWYDVLPGDTAFVMLGNSVPDAALRRERILVLTNFLDELKRRFKKWETPRVAMSECCKVWTGTL